MNNNYINFSQLTPFILNKNNPLIDLGYIKVEKKNNNLTLYDTMNFGELTTFNANNFNNVYSYVVNFFKYIQKNNINREKVLILGFGIGGMPLKLSQDKNVKQIDSVDYDHNLFRIFKSLIKNPSNKLNYIHNDANKYVKNPNTKYDIIFDDIFDSKYGKVVLNYNDIYKSLNDNGYLFINIHTKKQLFEIIPKLEKYEIIDLINDEEKLLICKKSNIKNYKSFEKYLKYKIKYINYQRRYVNQ